MLVWFLGEEERTTTVDGGRMIGIVERSMPTTCEEREREDRVAQNGEIERDDAIEANGKS